MTYCIPTHKKGCIWASATVVLALALIAALTACGGTKSASGTVGKQLVVQIGPRVETIDPALNSAEDSGHYLLYTFERLLSVDSNNQIAPGAAESWEMSDDGLEYVFHLREGLKWSDGSPLTADDFVYSWRRIADPNTAAPYGETLLGMVAGYREAIGNPDAEGNPTTEPDTSKLAIEAVDPLTLRVRLSTPTSYFDKLVAFESMSPVQSATVEANGDRWATRADTYISNGPFYVSEWVPSSYLVLTKNPYYWNANAIKLDSIKCLLIEDDNAAFGTYQTGEAQFIRNIPSEEIKLLQGRPDFHVAPRQATSYIRFNMRVPVFTDSRVREAFSLAIDRVHLANTVLSGLSLPASSFVSRGVSDWDGSEFKDNANGGLPYIDVNTPEENLARARELMAEAGYPNGQGFPIVTYSTTENQSNRNVAEYLQQAWRQLGVTVNVETMEWASFLPARRAGDYQIASDAWAFDYDDPSNILELFYSTNGNNSSFYKNQVFDAAIDASRSETDPQTRFAYLHEAEDILMEDAALAPLLWSTSAWLMNESVTGWYRAPSGRMYLQYADIEK